MTITALVVIVIGGLAATDIRTIVALSAQGKEFRESGAAIQVFSAPESISGARCDALGALPGVLGAGATRSSPAPVEFLTMPRSGIDMVEGTPGLANVLDLKDSSQTGIWMSDSAAETLGAGEGTTIPTSIGTAKIAAHYRYPPDATDRSLAYAAITPVPATGDFDACWVLIWPYSQHLGSLIRATYSGDPEDQKSASLTQLNTRLGAQFDGPELFTNRNTAKAVLVAPAFGLALGIGYLRSRRLELAGALHAQVPKPALVAQTFLEMAAILLAAVVITLPITYLLAATSNPDPPWPAWHAGLRVIASGTIATLIGTTIATATTHERRLLNYFKDR